MANEKILKELQEKYNAGLSKEVYKKFSLCVTHIDVNFSILGKTAENDYDYYLSNLIKVAINEVKDNPLQTAEMKGIIKDFLIKNEIIKNTDDIEKIIDGYIDYNKQIEKKENAQKILNEIDITKLSDLDSNVDRLLTIKSDINYINYKEKNIDIQELYFKTHENKNIVNDYQSRFDIKITKNAITSFISYTNHGKSTFIRNLLLEMATDEKYDDTMILFSLEDRNNKVYDNLLQILAGKKQDDLANDKEAKEKANDILYQLWKKEKLFIFDDYNDIDEIIQITRSIEKDYNKPVTIIIDFVSLIKTKENINPKTYLIESIMTKLGNLRNTSETTIILTAQLNREINQPKEVLNPVQINHIRDSASIEQQSERIYSIYNRYEHENQIRTESNDQEEHRGKLYLKELKQKDDISTIKDIKLYFNNSKQLRLATKTDTNF